MKVLFEPVDVILIKQLGQGKEEEYKLEEIGKINLSCGDLKWSVLFKVVLLKILTYLSFINKFFKKT